MHVARGKRIGFTLLELVIVMLLVGGILAITVPGAQRMLDRISVHAAAADVAATLGRARSLALAGQAAVAVDIDTVKGTLRVRRGGEVLYVRDVGAAHLVRLRASRDSLAFTHRGLGRGAANLSVIVHRRVTAETVFVSRLGRVR